jgi:hypothetical protein
MGRAWSPLGRWRLGWLSWPRAFTPRVREVARSTCSSGTGRDVFSGGVDGVRAVLDEGWDAIRGVLLDGLLIVLIAPPPGDAHAEAARPAAASISAE